MSGSGQIVMTVDLVERYFLKKLPTVLISYVNDFVDIDSRVKSVFLALYPNSGPRSWTNPRFYKLRGLSLGEEETEACGTHNLTCVERTLPINAEKSISLWVEIWQDAAPFVRRDRGLSELSAASEGSEVLVGYQLLSEQVGDDEPLDEYYHSL